MATPNLNEIHDTLVELAYKAGDIINNALPDTNTSDPGSKKNSADLVTQYDRAVESMISTSLKEKFPTYAFHGEETYTPTNPLTNSPTFIIDPIDGTINFIHNFPHACVSLGFAVNKIPSVGVVYNPSSGVLYSAIKGQGAFKTQPQPQSQSQSQQRQRLPLRNPTPLTGLSNALVAIEWGSDRSGPNWDVKVATFAKLGSSKENGGAMVRSFRSLGSAALNICAVAEGTVDLYWEGGCWEWDVCAGWVILEEAGGCIVDGNPGQWGDRVDLDGRRYLAVRGAEAGNGQREIVEEFWGFVQGKLDY